MLETVRGLGYTGIELGPPGYLGVESVRYSLLILLSGCVAAAWISFAVNASVREDLILAGVRT